MYDRYICLNLFFLFKKIKQFIELWKHLVSKNRLGDFVKICVDNNPKIPSSVTTVPSIFIKGRPLISGPAIQMFLNNPQISATTEFKIPGLISGKAPNNSRALDKTPEVTSSTNNLGGILDLILLKWEIHFRIVIHLFKIIHLHGFFVINS